MSNQIFTPATDALSHPARTGHLWWSLIGAALAMFVAVAALIGCATQLDAPERTMATARGDSRRSHELERLAAQSVPWLRANSRFTKIEVPPILLTDDRTFSGFREAAFGGAKLGEIHKLMNVPAFYLPWCEAGRARDGIIFISHAALAAEEARRVQPEIWRRLVVFHEFVHHLQLAHDGCHPLSVDLYCRYEAEAALLPLRWLADEARSAGRTVNTDVLPTEDDVRRECEKVMAVK